ncbi:MAG: GNAT family N-acetyltransferase [Gammaproteobacteria bacterium]|nr:GNAT family N-acetyltransferase [Gammaproteobacteria bacterium]
MSTSLAIRPNPPRAALTALLQSAGLPFDDLESLGKASFLGLWEGADLVGAVGLEHFGDSGLLRSLVVAESLRQHQHGSRLLQAMERHARNSGITALYLLTTDARGYFSKAGYRAVARANAPTAIRSTQQFARLCPNDAEFMHKPLD